jgi:hypothetical protein
MQPVIVMTGVPGQEPLVMIERDVLLTLAELAVALAGFSAIIGVLGARKSSADIKVNALRLQVMLETSFMVAAAALIPVLLDQFNLSPAMLWRVAAAIFLCMAIPYEFIARKRTKDMPDMTLTRVNINTINWGLSIGADLILITILFGFIAKNPDAFYLVTLLSQLTLAGILFVQFAAETFTHPDQD